MALQVLQGAIRKGEPFVRLIEAGELTPRRVTFRFNRAGQTVGELSRRWPQDFEDGGVRLAGAQAFEPYASVDAYVEGERLPRPVQWELKNLYAEDEEAFEAIFFRARDRPADPETQFFAATQICDHYQVNESHRCVAAVIQGYRAIDLLEKKFTSKAVASLRAQLLQASALPVSWRPRLDGVHLAASMYAVLWQLHLLVGEGDAATAQLDEMIAYVRGVEAPLATIVINACPAMLVRAHLLLAEGRKEEAIELCYFNADFYVSCLQRLKRLRKLFKEMMAPHTTVMLALDLAERAKRGDKGLDDSQIMNSGLRVDRASPGFKLVLENYGRHRRRLRRRRDADATPS